MARGETALKQRRVALAFQLGAPYQERITHGILSYAKEQGGWEIVSSLEGSALELESLAQWKGDGIIAMLETGRQVEVAEKLHVAVVNIANSLRTPGIPTVAGNQRAIGEMAAEHLLARNFRRFGFYGLRDVWYSKERYEGFRKRLHEAGAEVSLHETESSLLSDEPWRIDRVPLDRWLLHLATPAAILCAHDYRARMVLERCSELGLRVPEEIAVVGVDDDPIVCDFSDPPLTSIRQDGYEVGRQAAAAVEKLFRRSAEVKDIFVMPEALVQRESTKVTAVEDADLRKCLDLIDRHCREPIDVAWLVSQVGVSRRKLENVFQSELQQTPHEVLSKARIEKAKALLQARQKRPLKEIAEQCGFSDARRFTIVFRRHEKMSPRDYRLASFG